MRWLSQHGQNGCNPAASAWNEVLFSKESILWISLHAFRRWRFLHQPYGKERIFLCLGFRYRANLTCATPFSFRAGAPMRKWLSGAWVVRFCMHSDNPARISGALLASDIFLRERTSPFGRSLSFSPLIDAVGFSYFFLQLYRSAISVSFAFFGDLFCSSCRPCCSDSAIRSSEKTIFTRWASVESCKRSEHPTSFLVSNQLGLAPRPRSSCSMSDRMGEKESSR